MGGAKSGFKAFGRRLYSRPKAKIPFLSTHRTRVEQQASERAEPSKQNRTIMRDMPRKSHVYNGKKKRYSATFDDEVNCFNNKKGYTSHF